MSAQHTTGILTIHVDGADGWPLLMVGGPAGRIVANVNTESGVDTTKAPSIAFKKMPGTENARRLAACWNACNGISTENLEDNLPVHELATRYNAALRDRDSLRTALEFLMERCPEPNCSCHISPPCNDCVDHSGEREAWEFARDLLAKLGPKS